MEDVIIPPWCKPNGWVFNLPTRTVFQATRLQRDRQDGSLYLLDGNGHEYLLDDCQELALVHLQQPARLIWPSKPPANLIPATNGFILTAGRFRKLIYIPDEGEKAARSLAEFFNGVIFTDEPDQ